MFVVQHVTIVNALAFECLGTAVADREQLHDRRFQLSLTQDTLQALASRFRNYLGHRLASFLCELPRQDMSGGVPNVQTQ